MTATDTIMQTCIELHMRFTQGSDIDTETTFTPEETQAIHQYVATYKGDDKFLRDVASRLPFYPNLSPKQRVVVARKMLVNFRQWFARTNAVITYADNRYEIVIDETRSAILAPEDPAPPKTTTSLRVLEPIQCGIYTVELADTYVTLKITPITGKDDITHCISWLAGPDNGNDYVGFAWITMSNDARIWYRFRNNISLTEALTQFLEGTFVLQAAHCNRCGRLLTVPTSLHQGYGPECIKHVGGL